VGQKGLHPSTETSGLGEVGAEEGRGRTENSLSSLPRQNGTTLRLLSTKEEKGTVVRRDLVVAKNSSKRRGPVTDHRRRATKTIKDAEGQKRNRAVRYLPGYREGKDPSKELGASSALSRYLQRHDEKRKVVGGIRLDLTEGVRNRSSPAPEASVLEGRHGNLVTGRRGTRSRVTVRLSRPGGYITLQRRRDMRPT